jgi:hypothetical protein
MDRLRKHKKFLKQLLIQKKKKITLAPKEVGKFNDQQICVICELVKNLIHNPSLKLGEKERSLLGGHKQQIRQLIDRRVKKSKKRRILQKGAGVLLPLIVGLIAPIISHLIGLNK